MSDALMKAYHSLNTADQLLWVSPQTKETRTWVYIGKKDCVPKKWDYFWATWSWRQCVTSWRHLETSKVLLPLINF